MDIQIIQMARPDMPAALYAKAVDAYCTGEPFGAAAQRAGYARVLRMTRDEWRNYICCVLRVREEPIQENPALVQGLVNHVLGAGVWLDAKPENRSKAVAIGAGIEKPDRGSVAIDSVARNLPSSKGILITQHRSIFSWLTVQQNLSFGLNRHPRGKGNAGRSLRCNGAAQGVQVGLSA